MLGTNITDKVNLRSVLIQQEWFEGNWFDKLNIEYSGSIGPSCICIYIQLVGLSRSGVVYSSLDDLVFELDSYLKFNTKSGYSKKKKRFRSAFILSKLEQGGLIKLKTNDTFSYEVYDIVHEEWN